MCINKAEKVLLTAQQKFCTDYAKECSSAGGAYGDCLSEVERMPTGKAGATKGATFECRKYHLSAAMTAPAKERRDAHVTATNIQLHCPHVSTPPSYLHARCCLGMGDYFHLFIGTGEARA